MVRADARPGQDAAALIAAHRPDVGPDPRPGGQELDEDRIELMLADAGYCSQANLTCPGPALCAPNDQARRIDDGEWRISREARPAIFT